MKYLYLAIAIAIIALISGFSLGYWQHQYPLMVEFYDIAFHANAAVGMERAGGWTNVNFWAGINPGTPNTYFPFFHIVSLLILSLAKSAYFLTYWWSWAMLPLSFLTVLFFAAGVYGARTALYSVMLLALSPVWMEKQWGMPAQALVYVLTPLVFLAVAKGRYLIAAILTLCSAATHFTGIFLVPFLFLYALQDRDSRKALFIILGGLMLLGLPFIGFIFQRLSDAQLSVGISAGNLIGSIKGALGRMFSVRPVFHVYMGWLAAAGLAVCYFRRGKFLILPSYFLASFPLALTAWEMRFWTTPALFIFALLGGLALGSAHEWVEGLLRPFGPRNDKTGLSLQGAKRRSNLKRGLLGFMFFILVFPAAHALFYYASDRYPQTKIPSLVYLKSPDVWLRPGLTIDMDDREKIARLVQGNVGPDEFFWIDSSNNVNNYIALRTRRSTIKSITLEKNAMTLVKGIKLVVTRQAPAIAQPQYLFLDKINDEYNAYILRDPAKAAKVKLPKPLVTTKQIKLAFIIMGSLIALNGVRIIF